MKGFLNGVDCAKMLSIACFIACLASCLTSDPKRVVRSSPHGMVYMQSSFGGMERDEDGKEVVRIEIIAPTDDQGNQAVTDMSNLLIDYDARLEIFKKQISKGVDVNACDDWPGLPALAYAAACGDLEYIKELFARGASPRYERDDKEKEWVPFDREFNSVALAYGQGHREVAIYLLQHGAKARGVIAAIENDDIEFLDMLLAHGAKITEDEEFRENPSNLLYAQSERMLQYMLGKGADKKKALDNLVRMSDLYANPEAKREGYVRIGLVSEAKLKRLLKREKQRKPY